MRVTSYIGGLSVGLSTDEAVIMAAERKLAYGTLIQSKSGIQKVIPIADHLAISATGIPGDIQHLARIITAQAELYFLDHNKPISCRAAAKVLSNYLFSTRISFPKYIEPMIGGLDTKPRLFLLDLAGSVIEENFAATGTGTRLAMGIFEDNYENQMETPKAEELVIRAMKTGKERDTASGDVIDIIIIEKDKLTTEEIQIS